MSSPTAEDYFEQDMDKLPPEAEIDELLPTEEELETMELDKPEFTENNLNTVVDRIIWDK